MNVPAEILNKVTNYLSERFSKPCAMLRAGPVPGGCIHHAFRLDTNQGPFFLKWNKADQAENFHAERKGLDLLTAHSTDFIALPLTAGSTGNFSYLLLEFIEELPGTHPGFWKGFGEKLARLHKNTAPAFGLDHDNFIGRLPQINRQHADFIPFFIEERLLPQLKTARAANLIGKDTSRAFDRLWHRMPGLIPEEPPALLHGDLWEGNFLRRKNGRALLIDPAVYYGHREAEIAFTILFGGFAPEFYSAYHGAFPLSPGWEERTGLFNLYPLLVHLNMFGKSYLNGINNVLNAFK